jgi:aminoglycoside phosphotransferase (APT) family kinase protein
MDAAISETSRRTCDGNPTLIGGLPQARRERQNLPVVDARLMTPPKAARQWAAAAVGPSAQVVSARRLTGGITSATHVLSIEDSSGHRHRLVLRRWVGDPAHEGADSVRREASILTELASSGLPVPGLVAADPEGRSCGDPALLMTWLPGHIELAPRDPESWLGQMAEMLVRIHETGVRAPPFESWLDRDALTVPDWARRPELWREAIDLVNSEPPKTEMCFIHRDYQQFNLLWRRGKLAGVVDWVWASYGPPEVDIAHCRLNLTVLYTPEHAERFRLAYEAISGRSIEPWWDVAGFLVYLPGWGSFLQRQAGSKLTVDFAGMHERVERVLQASLSRV